MDRDSDDDRPVLRTREAAKRVPKIIRTRDAVDTLVRATLSGIVCAPSPPTGTNMSPQKQCFQSCLDESQRSREQSSLKTLGSSNVSGVYQGPSGGAVTAAGARARGRSSRMVSKPANPREERRKPVKGGSMLASALRKGKAC